MRKGFRNGAAAPREKGDRKIRDSKLGHTVAPVQPATTAAEGFRPFAPGGAAPRDAAALAGLLDRELTPRVRQAMTTLLGELDEVRRLLGDAHLRIGHLEKLVDEDPLIPVANRRAFLRELTRMIAFAQRYGVPASIVYFDIDNMKQINDQHTHAAGDAALLQVARLLIDNVRNTDVVGRLGGDELGVLLVQADQTQAEHKAAELAAAVAARPLEWLGQPVPITVAYGVHAFAGDEDAEAVIDAADRAMYRRKSRKKTAS